MFDLQKLERQIDAMIRRSSSMTNRSSLETPSHSQTWSVASRETSGLDYSQPLSLQYNESGRKSPAINSSKLANEWEIDPSSHVTFFFLHSASLQVSWNSSQTWTCVVKFDKIYLCAQFEASWCYSSLDMEWKLRQTKDLYFYGNVVNGGSSLWCSTVARILFNHIHSCVKFVQVCEEFQVLLALHGLDITYP